MPIFLPSAHVDSDAQVQPLSALSPVESARSPSLQVDSDIDAVDRPWGSDSEIQNQAWHAADSAIKLFMLGDVGFHEKQREEQKLPTSTDCFHATNA